MEIQFFKILIIPKDTVLKAAKKEYSSDCPGKDFNQMHGPV
jgi:hypothetical protein